MKYDFWKYGLPQLFGLFVIIHTCFHHKVVHIDITGTCNHKWLQYARLHSYTCALPRQLVCAAKNSKRASTTSTNKAIHYAMYNKSNSPNEQQRVKTQCTWNQRPSNWYMVMQSTATNCNVKFRPNSRRHECNKVHKCRHNEYGLQQTWNESSQ